MKRNALGRGLEALISMDDIQTGGSSAISEIPIAQITTALACQVQIHRQNNEPSKTKTEQE